MSTIEEKIEKGKKIADIIKNIEQLKDISKTLDTNIVLEISTNTHKNIVTSNGIFRKIVEKLINELKIDVVKTIDSLEEELDSIVK